jgi:uncharacterized Ntn-hydrolase superfamily protein
VTFSILARDAETGCLGIAIASRFFAVGAICPFVFPQLGALSTQASGHPPFGPAAERLLAEGHSAENVLTHLLRDDPDRERRQVHLIDRAGTAAAFTGRECIGVAGALTTANLSVAGNMLAADDVLDAAVAGYAAGGGLAARLLTALTAANKAGGDKRGQQAAAILIYGQQPFPMLSLRVDDDDAAVLRLSALFTAAATDYIPYIDRYFSTPERRGVFGQ